MASFVLPHALHGRGSHKVIAVHGWFADRSAFDPVLPDLDQEAFQYALVDLRGYGEARGETGSYTSGEGAADVLALADRLGWDRFSAVGHSMGASVVQRVLAAAPHRVRRLVGISPVPASGLPLPPQQWELFSSAAHLPENRRAIIDLTTGGRRPAAWLDRMVQRSLACSDPKAFRSWLDSWSGETFAAEVEGSAVPAAGGDRGAGSRADRRTDASDMDAVVRPQRAGRAAIGGALRHGRNPAGADPGRGGLSACRR